MSTTTRSLPCFAVSIIRFTPVLRRKVANINQGDCTLIAVRLSPCWKAAWVCTAVELQKYIRGVVDSDFSRVTGSLHVIPALPQSYAKRRCYDIRERFHWNRELFAKLWFLFPMPSVDEKACLTTHNLTPYHRFTICASRAHQLAR
jgi:hypothetical protein